MTTSPQQPGGSVQRPVPPPPAAPGNFGAVPPMVGRPVAPPPAPLTDGDARMWAMLSQLLTFVGHWIAPLVIYLVFRDRSQFTRDHAAESLNFQLTSLIVYTAGFVLGIIGLFAAVLPGVIIFIGLGVYAITALVWIVMASVRAYDGQLWRYPINIRFVH